MGFSALRPAWSMWANPLAERAELFIASHPGSQDALRRLFTLRLAQVPKEGEAVRRRAIRSDCREDEWTIAQQLAEPEWRLLSASRDGTVATVEVAHEMLLRKVASLVAWLDAERESPSGCGQLEAAQRGIRKPRPSTGATRLFSMGLSLATARRVDGGAWRAILQRRTRGLCCPQCRDRRCATCRRDAKSERIE